MLIWYCPVWICYWVSIRILSWTSGSQFVRASTGKQVFNRKTNENRQHINLGHRFGHIRDDVFYYFYYYCHSFDMNWNESRGRLFCWLYPMQGRESVCGIEQEQNTLNIKFSAKNKWLNQFHNKFCSRLNGAGWYRYTQLNIVDSLFTFFVAASILIQMLILF